MLWATPSAGQHITTSMVTVAAGYVGDSGALLEDFVVRAMALRRAAESVTDSAEG